MKQENYMKGMGDHIFSAFFFACMNISVRLAGDIPSFQKSFFRNLVAVIFAGVILLKNHEIPKVKAKPGTVVPALRLWYDGIFCNFYVLIIFWWQMRQY